MKLWVATKNSGKAEEIAQILGGGCLIKTLLDLPCLPDIEENGTTYSENAAIKAKALHTLVKEPVMADDSGLEVDYLNGEPGLHSARFSGPKANHQNNIDKLLRLLSGASKEKRTARFRCVVVYIDKNGEYHEFVGTLEGYIGFERQGKGGFGYDPVFMLPDKNCSLASLSSEEKNLLSHRFKAVSRLKQFLGL